MNTPTRIYNGNLKGQLNSIIINDLCQIISLYLIIVRKFKSKIN